MTDEAFETLYGLDRAARPRGLLAAALAFILRHATAVAVVMLALTAASAYLASQLELITDFSRLIPETSRAVVDQRQGEKYLGNSSLLVVEIRASDPRAEGVDEAGDAQSARAAGERARQAAVALSRHLAQDPEFDFVLHRFNREFFERNALLYLTVDQLDDLHQRLDRRIRDRVLQENPLFVDLLDEDDEDDERESDAAGEEHDAASVAGASAGAGDGRAGEQDILDPATFRRLYLEDRDELELGEYLVDEAGFTYLVLARPVQPPVDMSYNKRLLQHTRDEIAALGLVDRFGPGLEISLAGNYRSAAEEHDAVKSDLERGGLISAGLLVLVVLAYFRRKRALWIVFIPLLSGVVMMMGYVELVVGHLNTITGFSFALFMGLSIDFAIHFLARYDEERGRGRTVFEALLDTYRGTGRASMSAAATSSVGFLALAWADFEGFREFGIIAGGGIAICLLVIAVLLPTIVALSLRYSGERRFAAFRPDKALQRQRPPFARVLVAVGVVLLVVLGWRATELGWEDDFRNLRGSSTENQATASRVRAIMGRSTQPVVRLADSLEEAAQLARACNDERDRRGDASTVQRCISLADFLPEDQAAKLPAIAGIKGLLSDHRLDALDDDQADALRRMRDQAPSAPIGVDDLPAEVVMGFVGHGGDKYLMKAYHSGSTWLASYNIRFTEELRAGDDVIDGDIGPIGAAAIMADLMRVMRHDSAVVVVVALFAVFAVLLVLFRSATRALACYAPLLIGLTCTLGIMELMGWKMGLYNMIVLPSLIGLGVDNNIHLFHRYQAEGRGSWPYTIRTTGVACSMAAVTTMAGFAGLVVAGHRGLATIGYLAILGILTTTVVSLVFLPAVITLVESRVVGTGFGVFPRRLFDPAQRQRS